MMSTTTIKAMKEKYNIDYVPKGVEEKIKIEIKYYFNNK